MKTKKGDSNLSKALRFKEAIGQLGLKQKEAAEILECDESYLSRMLSGSITFSKNKLYKFKLHYPNLNMEYILNGKGKIFNIDDYSPSSQSYSVHHDKHHDSSAFQSLLEENRILKSSLDLANQRILLLENIQEIERFYNNHKKPEKE